MTLEQLVYEAKKGNKAAEEALFCRLCDNFLLMCIRYVKNEADAEERMLDGFYKFFRALPTFRYESDAALYAFLGRIMVNECIMQLRKKRLFNIVAEPLETDAMLEEDLLDRLSTGEIHETISKLPVGARTIFNLYAVEGYTHDEIASLLGISVSTSKSQVARARVLLQQSLSFLKKGHEKRSSK